MMEDVNFNESNASSRPASPSTSSSGGKASGDEGARSNQQRDYRDRGGEEFKGNNTRHKRWHQFAAVGRKNALLIRKHLLGSTASQLLASVFVVLILKMMQGIGNSALSKPDPSPQVHHVPRIESCDSSAASVSSCDTLLYAPQGIRWVEEVMDIVRKQNGLTETDVRPVPNLTTLNDQSLQQSWCMDDYNTLSPCQTESFNITADFPEAFKVPNILCASSMLAQGHILEPCAKMRDNDTITAYMLENPGRARNIVFFPGAYLGVGTDVAATIPFGYHLYYNSTIGGFPFRGDDHALQVKKALDQAMLSFAKEREDTDKSLLKSDESSLDAEIRVSWSTFPKPEPRLKGFSAVAVGGGYWFYLPPMIIFFNTLIDIVREKENGSRLMMSVMGLPNFINWLVWFLQGSLFSQISSLVLILSGLACNFDIFWNSNVLVLFLLFSFFGIAMTSASQLLATLMSSVKGAQTVGYAIILIGFVFQTILGSGYGSLIYLLQSESLPGWAVPIRYLLQLYPPYLMSMMYYIVSKKSSSIVNVQEAKIEKGVGFQFADLFASPDVNQSKLFGTIEVNVPTPAYCLLMMLVDALLFALLALYFDHVVPTGNGIIHHPLFFLKPGYWFPKRKARSHSKLEDQKESAQIVEMLSDFQNKEVVDEAIHVNEKLDHYAENDSEILVSLLTKSYDQCSNLNISTCSGRRSKRAVDRLSMRLEKNSIFCLLGHNGAGKSTTMNILTGIIAPSSGFVSICGHDVREDLHNVQSLIGVSPQFDCLWDELNAFQHLRLYASVKGIPSNSIDEETEYCLSYVDLVGVADKPVHTYSGGMKRRLSLAIALIGDPKAIFLDEPTTGMDPVHKQEAWSMIQRMKEDRIVVLTTHSMEEADCLGDRIGIMGSGRLQCIGTSLSLKNAFGSGYRLKLYAPVRKQAKMLADKILGELPESNLLRYNAGSMVFMVPFHNVENLPTVMNLLEKEYADQILEWSISHTTLEEVFLQVTNNCGFATDFESSNGVDFEDEADDDDNDLELLSPQEAKSRVLKKETPEISDRPRHTFEIEMPPPSKDDSRPRRFTCGSLKGSVYGLVVKNAVLQKRQKFQLMCQVGTPILIMLCLTFLQVLVRVEDNKFSLDGSGKILMKSIPYSLDSGFGLPFGADLMGSNTSSGKYCLQHFSYFAEAGEQSLVGELGMSGESGGLLGHIPQHTCKLYYGNGKEISAPYFEEAASESMMMGKLYDDLMEVNTYNMTSLGDEPHPSYLLPDGAISFKSLSAETMSLDYYLTMNDNFLLAYHRPNGITRARISPEISESFQNTGFSVLGNQGRLYGMEMINRAFMRSILKSHDYFYEVLETMPYYVKPLLGVGSVLYNMPHYEASRLQSIVQLFGSFLYPIALVLQLPLYMYVSVMEKERNLRQCQLNHGMSLLLYHVSSFIFNMCMYSCIVIFMVIVGNIVGLSFFSETGQDVLVFFFIGWGLSMVSFAMFLSSFVNSSRTATVIGYSVVLFGSGLGIMLSQGVYGDNPTRTHVPVMPTFLNILPQFAMVRSVYLMNWSCSMKYQCISELHTSESKELETCIGFMYLDFLLYFLLGFYLDKVLPKPNEPSSHWLFFLPKCCRRQSSKISPTQSMQDILSEQHQMSDRYNPSHLRRSGVLIDEDVQEEERLACYTSPTEHEVVIQNLTKEFGEKAAVQNMGLVINSNECFGLLGENGAGKTTLINMLSCSMAPTQGTAYLAGYDIRTQSENIQKLLGICPQFDVLWEDMSIKEHLLLFLRLKKVGVDKEKLQEIMHEVGLIPFQNKLVKELSGGMKRRLSVAIALVGESRVILLDEVTTGLDPFSRRQLWNILKKCQDKRAMILTTHSMDEAELLCTRLGIMVNGRLQCIGTSSYLKEKFGPGYMLLLNFEEASKQHVLSFLTQKFYLTSTGPSEENHEATGTVLIKDFPGQLIVRIPIHKGDGGVSGESCSHKPSTTAADIGKRATHSSNLKMSAIFSVMVNEAHQHGITDWAVSQVGLNEIFQSVLAKAKSTSSSASVTDQACIP
jgi:ABC-type multidrug transport system ATPase subunit